MSRRPRTRRSRSILSSLNPFSSSIDRAMDFKRQGLGYSRGLRCEQLEDRRLLAVRALAGFEANALDRGDDVAQFASLDFEINFFGEQYDQLFVNTNGYISFDTFDIPQGGSGEVVPTPGFDGGSDLALPDLQLPIIAPFWSDVDTTDTSTGAVTFGADTLDGRSVFGVNWTDVSYDGAATDDTNDFQLILIDRSDVGAGAFDLEFNYDAITWESGADSGGDDGLGGASARAGFSSESSMFGEFYELIGSGNDGAFLDGDASTGLAANSLMSSEPGRYVFEFRSGSSLDDLGLVGQTVDVTGEIVALGAGIPPEFLELELPTNADAADTTNTDQLAAGGGLGFSLDGAGYTAGVWEAGGDTAYPRTTHQDFGGRVTIVDNAAPTFSRHATHVTGTIASGGIDAAAQGMAPQVQVRAYNSSNDIAELRNDAALIVASNHSYGFDQGWSTRANIAAFPAGADTWLADRSTLAVEDGDFGKYNDKSQDLDDALFDNPNLLTFWAAGNERNDLFTDALSSNQYVTWLSAGPMGAMWYLVTSAGANSAPPQDGNGGLGFDSITDGGPTSKNAVVVGAISDITADPLPALVNADLTGFSSWGPTDDGRIKPDLVANGDTLRSTVETGDADYGNSSGTSMATPNAAGTGVLLVEHFENLNGFTPRSATTKGLMIHTAVDGGNVGPDYSFGWGLLDAAAAANFLTRADSPVPGLLREVRETSLADGSTNSFTVDVVAGEPLKVTLAWTDPAGTLSPAGVDNVTRALVNDLDLTITGPGGTFMPWTLDSANPANPAVRTARNSLDNVEQVVVDTPATGSYTISVSHTGDLQDEANQAYSLLVSGAFIAPDDFEPNDSIETATVLGSLPAITLRDLSIDDTDDQDFFKYTANVTGKLVVNALFDDLQPGDDEQDLSLEIQDMLGNVIASSTTTDSNEQVVIPVVSQEMYFIRVFSTDDPTTAGLNEGDDVNLYSLEIENFPAPVPTGVHLNPADDTGMNNNDNVTSETQPEFFIQTDVLNFVDENENGLADAGEIDVLTAAEAEAGVTDGIAVQITLVNTSDASQDPIIEFANPLIAQFPEVYRFTPSSPLPDGVYFVTARTVIFDSREIDEDPATAGTQRKVGRSTASPPLWVTIDSGDAAGDFSADLIASSDTGMFDDDNVTNKMSPAIQGVAPAGSKVRLYANGALVGQTVTGSDTSDVGIGGVGGLGGASDDGLGLWEITTEPLADGTYDLTLEFEDAAGNVQTFNPMFNGDDQTIDIEIDTTKPNTPVLDLRNDTGENLADEITSDSTPDVSMTTTDPALLARLFTDNLKFRIFDRFEDNQEFLLYDSAQDAAEDADNVAGDMFTANTVILETLAAQFVALNAGGNFAVNAAGELEDGVHNLKLEVEDRAGNISDDFLLEVFIDTVDPAAVTPNLLDSSDSGMFNDDNVTNKWSPAFDGVAEINNKVFVYATRINPATGNPFDGTQILIGEGIVGSENSDDVNNNGLGRWEVTVEPLVDGVYDITVRFEDWAGNFTPLDESLNNELRIVIDKEAPNTPFLDLIDDTGRHDHDEVTKENEPVVTMTSTDPNIQLAQVLFDDNLKFRIYDRYESTAEFLLYDSAADAAEDAANLAGDMFTANTFITETLAAQFIAGNPANAAVLAGGILADGVHNLKLEVEDRAGNISHDFLLTVTVDTITPPVSFGLPAAVNAEDGLDASSDSGVTTMPATYADRVTSDTTPALWGRAEANTIIRVYHDDDGDGVIDLSANPAVGDTFLGQTVAVPFDGNDAYPDGFWHINSVLDLNHILGLPKDGVRQLLVTAEDLAGNPMPMDLEIADGVDSLNIFLDTQGPQVYDPAGATQAVHPTVDPTYDLFDPKPSENGFTPLIDQITIHVRDLPLRSNVDANFLYEALKEDIAEVVGNYTLVGDHVGPIGITNVDVVNVAAVNNQQAKATITLTFADFLPDDRYTLTVSDNLVDPAGNKLDGESNASGPLDDPTFPSGDGVPGGAFVGRFTVDSRPEIGTFIPTTIAIDINGNFVWDPSNAQIGNDATNVDLTFTMDRPGLVGGGFAVHDTVFAGKFVGGGFGGGPPEGGAPLARLFDQLGVYGYSAETSEHRWLIDLDSDGVTDIYSSQPVLTSFGLDTVGALPVAGNFDNDLTNGDEIGLYYAGNWGFDFNHNFVIEPGEIVANTGLFGVPIVGDFDGNGVDDVAVFNNNNFTFALSGGAFGAFAAFPQFQWGFSGVLERPVAADMDQDGIDDIGLFVPRNTAQPLRQTAEWYFLLSGFADQVDLSVGAIAHAFEPVPFGDDLYAEFGDELALPIVGNFDPPVVASEVDSNNFTQLPGDFDNSGMVDEHDFTMWQESYGETGVNMAADADGDGVVGLADYTMWREHVGMTAASGGDYDGSGAVDEGDYETWRNQFGQIGTLLAADGNGDGRVDMADFAVWRNNMGASASSLVFASAEYSAAQPAPVAAGLQASPAAQSTAFAAVGPALPLGDSQDEQQGPRAVLAVEALFADHADDLLLIADRLPTSDEGDTLQSDGLDEAEEQTERETDAAFAQL